jgi:hypothetical protein
VKYDTLYHKDDDCVEAHMPDDHKYPDGDLDEGELEDYSFFDEDE